MPSVADTLIHIRFCSTIAEITYDTLVLSSVYKNGNIDTLIIPILVDIIPSSIPESLLPSMLVLNNYPNPFRTSTTVELGALAEQAERITVVDMLGREVAVLKRGSEPPPTNEIIQWSPDAGTPTGTYFLRVVTRAGIVAKPMVYMQ